MTRTESQFAQVLKPCKELFLKKNEDYGTSWRILRLPSLTDQIFIKASRIRAIQEKGLQKISDPVETEFVGIINYCIIAMIQLELAGKPPGQDPGPQEIAQLYDRMVAENQSLLSDKNHDYAEAWRDMRVPSITDIILMKLHRLKQIENNDGKTLVSEGVKANYQDIFNYSVFALILLHESRNPA